MSERLFNILFTLHGQFSAVDHGRGDLERSAQRAFESLFGRSHPKGEIHPLALKMISEAGYPTAGLRSKNWDEFARPDAPQMDFVFTVCDNAAGEVCPVWPGRPMTAHWPIEDPAAVAGTPIEQERAFVLAMKYLSNRIGAFSQLPIKGLNELTLQKRLQEIGRMPA